LPNARFAKCWRETFPNAIPRSPRQVEGGPGIAEDFVDKSYAVLSSRNRLDTNMLNMLEECRTAWLLLASNFPAST